MAIGIRGIDPAIGYDRLVVNGSAVIAGALRVDAIDGFAPITRDELQVFTYSSRENEFPLITGNLAEAITLRYEQSAVYVSGTANSAIGRVANPVFLPAGGEVQRTDLIAIESATEGAEIRYTIDGTTPTITSLLYTGPFQLTGGTTIYARAYKAGLIESAATSATFVVRRTSDELGDWSGTWIGKFGSIHTRLEIQWIDGVLTARGGFSGAPIEVAGEQLTLKAIHPSTGELELWRPADNNARLVLNFSGNLASFSYVDGGTVRRGLLGRGVDVATTTTYLPFAGDFTDYSLGNVANLTSESVTLVSDSGFNEGRAAMIGNGGQLTAANFFYQSLFSANWSLGFRVRLGQETLRGVIFSAEDTTGKGVRITAHDGELRYSDYTRSGDAISENSSIVLASGTEDGLWHHVAIVQLGASRTLFWDGIAVETPDVTTLALGNVPQIRFGALASAGEGSPSWSFDEVFIASTAFTQSQVFELAAMPDSKVVQTITFPDLPDRRFSSASIQLAATATSGLPVSFAVIGGPATIIDGELQLLGLGEIRIRATQAGDSTYLPAASVDRSFNVGQSYEHWSITEFGGQGAHIPTDDSDGDGLTNLIEYALGLDPRSQDASHGPLIQATSGEWTFTYRRPADRSDLFYSVEASTNLRDWASVGLSHERVSTDGETEVWRATRPISGAPTAFFRLRVSVVP